MPSLPPAPVARRRKGFRALVVGLTVANGVALAARAATAPTQRELSRGPPEATAATIGSAALRELRVGGGQRGGPEERERDGGATRAPGRPGTLVVVPGRSVGPAASKHRRFLVEVEGGLRVDPAAFAGAVERMLFHPRGWSGMGFSFQRVDRPPVDFRVALASPPTTDSLCAPLETAGTYSCYMSGRAVLNFRRWSEGASTYGDDLAPYRHYMVNHEVGHALGYGHDACHGIGQPAPVMMQQTKGLGGCRPNPWPMPGPSG